MYRLVWGNNVIQNEVNKKDKASCKWSNKRISANFIKSLTQHSTTYYKTKYEWFFGKNEIFSWIYYELKSEQQVEIKHRVPN